MSRSIKLPEKFINKGVSKKITEIKSVTGFVELKMDPAIRKMARELERMIAGVTPLELEASEICKEMLINMSKVREGFDQLGQICSSIHKRYKNVAEKFDFEHFTKISELYLSLNSTMTEWGNVYQKEADNYFENIRMMFDFSLSETEGLDQVKSN